MTTISYLVKCCAVLATLVLTAKAHDDKFLICKPVQSIFASHSPGSNSSSYGPQGPPGRPGPRGLPGPVGPQGRDGSPAKIDWKAIDEHISVRIDARLKCSGVVYGRHCYKLIYKAVKFESLGGKSEAASQCAYRGGSLVDIESEEMYNVLYAYIQDQWIAFIDQPQYDYTDVWLASSYETGVLRHSTGGAVYTKWYETFPRSNSPGIAWIVATKPTRISSRTGMYNIKVDYARPVPFCRFDMN